MPWCSPRTRPSVETTSPAGRFRLALLLGQISVDELAIASRGHKANFLAIGLIRHRQAPGASDGAHFLLGHFSQRKLRVRQLLLRQSKEEVGLVFRTIDAAQKLVTAGFRVAPDARVMAGGDALRADLPRRGEELRELDFGIAKAARDGGLAGQIALHERPHHGSFKLLFQVDDVVGNVEKVGHGARIVDVVERAAAPAGVAALARLLAQQLRQAALVPKLHGQPHHFRR